MFSEKIENWKQITAGFAIFGFILSLIFGIFGGVLFGIIILRALLFAVLFGGLALGVMKLIEIFIPEFFSGDFDNDDSDDTDSSIIIEEDAENAPAARNGSNLDITIEDDDSDGGGSFDAVEEVEPVEADAETAEVEDLENAEDVEEVEEIEEAGDAEDVEELTSEGGDEKPEPDGAVEEKKGGKNGDLPDIGVYADSFSAPEVSEDNEGLSSIDGAGDSGGAEIMGGMHDTQEIVKAVQTVLKKDQEG